MKDDYSLAALRKLRQSETQAAQSAHARAQRELTALSTERDRCAQVLVSVRHEIYSARVDRFSSADSAATSLAYEEFLKAMAHKAMRAFEAVAAQERLVLQGQAALERAQETLVAARAAENVIDKHYARWRQEKKVALDRRQEDARDEEVTNRGHRK